MHDKKKKVLILVTLGELGGAQKYVQQIALGLKGDFDLSVGTEENSMLIEWAHEQGFRTHPLKYIKRNIAAGFLPSLSDARALKEIYDICRKEQYDVVHLNSSKMGLIGALAARLARVPRVVFTVHGWVFRHDEVSSRGRKWLWILASKCAAYFQDRIIVITEFDLDEAVRYHIVPPRKLFRLYNGFDPRSVTFMSRPKAREWLTQTAGIGAEERVVGTIANLYPTKDLATMIRAVASVSSHPHLVIIGGPGPQSKEDLEEHARELGIETRVHFLGIVPDAPRYLRAFDVYAISSLKEGLPFSLFEAMAAGLPIVSTAVGGIPEVLSPHTSLSGLLVPPKDPAALAEAIEKILSNAKLAHELSKKAKERLAAFSYDEMIERTKWVYEL